MLPQSLLNRAQAFMESRTPRSFQSYFGVVDRRTARRVDLDQAGQRLACNPKIVRLLIFLPSLGIHEDSPAFTASVFAFRADAAKAVEAPGLTDHVRCSHGFKRNTGKRLYLYVQSPGTKQHGGRLIYRGTAAPGRLAPGWLTMLITGHAQRRSHSATGLSF